MFANLETEQVSPDLPQSAASDSRCENMSSPYIILYYIYIILWSSYASEIVFNFLRMIITARNPLVTR